MIEKYNINDLNNSRGENKKKKNTFKTYKDNTLKSLNEVEYFLDNWKRAWKGIRLFKILKWVLNLNYICKQAV